MRYPESANCMCCTKVCQFWKGKYSKEGCIRCIEDERSHREREEKAQRVFVMTESTRDVFVESFVENSTLPVEVKT